jgi:hypothetical protein
MSIIDLKCLLYGVLRTTCKSTIYIKVESIATMMMITGKGAVISNIVATHRLNESVVGIVQGGKIQNTITCFKHHILLGFINSNRTCSIQPRLSISLDEIVQEIKNVPTALHNHFVTYSVLEVPIFVAHLVPIFVPHRQRLFHVVVYPFLLRVLPLIVISNQSTLWQHVHVQLHHTIIYKSQQESTLRTHEP